jgi:prephenate dehydrogenase
VSQPPGTGPARVVVVGTGLIGTSIGLALAEHGTEVWLADRDPATLRLAESLGAGRRLPGEQPPGGPADVAVIAVPPTAVGAVLAQAQAAGLARWYTDVASVKELPLASARELGCDITTYVPGHPVSGRERSGPVAARADLFQGRPWAICPAPETSEAGVTAVTGLALACGSLPVELTAAEHDAAIALTSHTPHLVATVLAASLLRAPGRALTLAGPGLRDVTRIASGDSELWTQILTANAAHAADLLAGLAADLGAASATLNQIAKGDRAAVTRLTETLDQGRDGVGRLPGKRSGPAPEYQVVQVAISDEPGELARLFQAAGAAGINIEDVEVQHVPDRPAGVAELYVTPQAVGPLAAALAAGGWPVRR